MRVNNHTLLLEPMWNWNSWTTALHTRNRQASTRTNVELKPIEIAKEGADKNGLLLEPMWNWNQDGKTCSYSVITLLLEPMWNWNGREELLNCCQQCTFYSNQCGIETIYERSCCRILFILLLEPMWNWNAKYHFYYKNELDDFYSNQCGIETGFGVQSNGIGVGTSTRTNVELKQLNASLIPKSMMVFYSNQCGIETNGNHRVWDRRRSSSTRTNVELKPWWFQE